ncbi:MAG: molybdenum cofactor guanylyltransferase MobA [Gammaproteobacteria bacterium]|nr:molybdenum cofactor guanylyltransferase MobA [Gammaproteobacteria bacterium]
MTDIHPTTGLILAGGRSSRMGQNKALLQLQGKTLLQRAIERLAPQVEGLLISTNSPLAGAGSYPQLSDRVGGYAGPLAGILTGLEWLAGQQSRHQWLLSVAVDTPFFPLDLNRNLQQAAQTDTLVIAASSGKRAHPTCALWHIRVLPRLRQFLETDQQRRMMHFVESLHYQRVEFAADPVDPFFNINTAADLSEVAAGLYKGNTPYLEGL